MMRSRKTRINYAKDWQYTTNDTAALVTKYVGNKTDVVVPSTLGGKTTVMSTAVFQGTRVNSVDLSGVNFAGNNMANAFNGCTNLKSVKNMSPYINQANDAFHGCANLTGVYAQNENEKTFDVAIGEFHNAVNMFRNCYNMTRVPTLMGLYTDSTRIANYSHMFENCSKLTQSYYDFWGSGFAGDTVDISYLYANCQNLIYSNAVGFSLQGNVNASHAFDNTGYMYMGQITDPGMSGDKSKFSFSFGNLNASYMFANCKNMVMANFKGVSASGSADFANAFYNCQNLTDVKNIPNDITSANYMFANCRKLVNISPMQKGLLGAHDMCQNCVSLKNAVEIPDTVTSMWGIYRNCSNLVNVPLSAISLNATDMDSAFYGCTNLVTAPIIPPNITDLRNAFNGCTNLTGNVTIYTNKLTSYASVFSNTTKAKNVYIYNTNTASNMWNVWNNTTSGVNGKNGVTLINMGTWENACWTYTTSGTDTLVTEYRGSENNVYVPDKINGKNVVLQTAYYRRGNYYGPFANKWSILSIKFGKVAQFEDNNASHAFYRCSGLTNAPIILPSNVVNLSEAFVNCYNLTKAPIIPNSVMSMSRTFHNCWNLVNAPIIPANVMDMTYTFSNCTNLRNAPVIPANVTNLTGTFSNCTSLVNAPSILTNKAKDWFSTFEFCRSLKKAPTIPEGAGWLDSTFFYCNSLVNAPIIPSTVYNMRCAFCGCSNLTGNIIIKSNHIENKGFEMTFDNTSLSKHVYIPKTGKDVVNNTWYQAQGSYGINGKNGVTIYDINTYKGSY